MSAELVTSSLSTSALSRCSAAREESASGLRAVITARQPRLYTGAQWREVPERYGKAKSIYDRFNFWRADGTLDKILDRLHLRLNEEGRLDTALWCVDATSIRASRSAAGAARGKKERAKARV